MQGIWQDVLLLFFIISTVSAIQVILHKYFAAVVVHLEVDFESGKDRPGVHTIKIFFKNSVRNGEVRETAMVHHYTSGKH
jgi:hypothetical protein